MHDDATDPVAARRPEHWQRYLTQLQARGTFGGGSSIGGGATFSKQGKTAPIAAHLTGFIRIQAHDLEEARALLEGNPVFEAGGTVEIRELPKDSA